MASLPNLSDYFATPTTDANYQPANAAPQPTGTGDWFTAALGSGWHQALSEAGSAGEAVGRAVGADNFADNAKAFSDAERASAATYQRADLENAPWYDPEALAYRVTQGLPTLGAGLAGAGLATLAAPESAAAGVIGGAAAMLPSMIGGNVQRREDYAGNLDQGQALKAIGLGIPEAAIQGLMPAAAEGRIFTKLGDYLGKGVVGAAAKSAIIQAPASMATEWITQQMGDPNRSLAQKAQDIISAGLSGGVMGGVAGGLLHPFLPAHEIAKTPAAEVTPDQLGKVVDQSLAPPAPAVEPPAPGDVVQANIAQNQAAEVAQAAQVAPAPAPEMAPQPAPEVVPAPAPGVLPATPVAPEWDWVAQRKELQKAKAYSNIVKGPFENRDTLVGTVADNFIARTVAGDDIPKSLQNAAKVLNITDVNGQLAEPFLTRANEAATSAAKPPGISPADDQATPLAGPTVFQAPERQDRAAIDLKHQGRWDQLEAVRNRLLGDNLSDPDVQQMLTTTADLQSSLLKPSKSGPNSWRNIEKATVSLKAQVDARDASAKAPPVGAPVEPNAPAQGPDPSPAAQEFIGRVTGATPTKEQAAKAARTGQTALPQRIQTAMQELGGGFNKRVSLVDLRSKLSDVPRDRLDAELTKMHVKDNFFMSGSDNPRELTPAMKQAGLNYKDEPMYFAWQTKPSELVEPTTLKEQTARESDAPAPPPVTSADMAAQTPNQAFAEAFARQSQREGGKTADIGVTAKRTRQQMAMDARRAAAVPKVTEEPTGRLAPPPLSTVEQERIAGLPPREQAIERDARYWEYLRTTSPDDIEARAQQAAKLDEATRQLAQPKAKDDITAEQLTQHAEGARIANQMTREAAPVTKEARAKQAREAMLAKRPPVDEKARGDIENQRTPEVVKPKLVKSVDEVPEAQPARELDPAKAADRAIMTRRAANEEAPPAVDISSLSGFARDGRRTQEDVRRQSLVNGLRTRLAMVESARRPVTSVPEKVLAHLDNAKRALMAMEQSGAIIPRHEDFAGKDQRFQQLLQQHGKQLGLVDRAARVGGMEGLREVPRDFFGTDLYDEMSGHVTPQTEKNLEAHATSESRLQDAAAVARGERPLIRYSVPPTQHDIDLTNVINSTGRMSDALGYVREQGTSVRSKEMANVLARAGAGGTIEMSDRPPPSTRQLQPGEVVAGYHFPEENHTQVYDGSGVEQTVLHEAAHSATEKALRAGTPAAREIESIFDRVKNLSDGDAYGLENPSEMVAEAFSNPAFEQFLKSQPVRTGSRISDMWQGFKNAVFRALGMPERVRTLFDQVMDTSNRLMGENVREASSNVNVQVRNGGQQFSEVSTQAGNALIRKVQRELDDRKSNLTIGARKIALALDPGDHIEWQIKDHIPAVVDYMGFQSHRPVRSSTLAKYSLRAINQVQRLPPVAKNAWARIAQRTSQNLDAFRSWKDHTWLKGIPQEAVLQQEHALAVRDADVLRRTPGGEAVYRASVDANMTSARLRSIYQMYDLQQREWAGENWIGENWIGYHNDPLREFEGQADIQDDPAASKAWTEQRQKEMLAGMAKKASDVGKLINSLKTKQAADQLLPPAQRMTPEQAQELNEDIKKAIANRKAMTDMVSDISDFEDRLKQGPYFHLGRDGDHFVSAHVISNNNIPDDRALVSIRDAMEERGYGDNVLMRGLDKTSIYARVETESQREELFELFHEQQQAGNVDASKEISRGMVDKDEFIQSIGPSYMRQAIEAIEAAKPDYPPGITPAQKASLDAAQDKQNRDIKRSWMAMLPDTSITKLYQKRQNVQGFNSDMMASYVASTIGHARGLASLSLSREIGASASAMNKQLEGLQQSTTIKGSRLTAVTQAMSELMLRNKLFQARVPSTFMDTIRHTVHSFQVGTSPAYVLMMGSQIFTQTLPEMAKTHGYVKSAIALAKVSPESFKVMRSVWKGEEGITFGMRRADLIAGGHDPKTVDFLMNLNARGAFNQSAFTEAIAGHQIDSSYEKVLQYADILGRYSEQFPRIQAALAARELYNSKMPPGFRGTVEDFAHKMVRSQFDWGEGTTPRYMSRTGTFGAMSPLINQFMGFTTRITAKIYREVADGFGEKRGTEEGRQARVWLYGHAAAVTMLAGTLGLPGVAIAASVFDRLADLVTGKDDWDVTAAYRNFLAQSLGKEFGEAVARGAPRLARMDFGHLGEGGLLPGVAGAPVVSKLLTFATEKRKMEDAEKDWLKNMAGPSVGYLFGVAAAMRDFSNGDVLDGMVRIMPEAFKGATEAYRLGQRGFVDKNGSELPITANATDVMMTALGIDPAKEAEYDELKKVYTGLQQMRNLRSQNITRHLMLAVNRDDPAMMQTWQREAIQFQQDHPGMLSPLATFERALAMHARNAAVARGFGTPLGVQPRDVIGRGMTSFGNLRQGEQ